MNYGWNYSSWRMAVMLVLHLRALNIKLRISSLLVCFQSGFLVKSYRQMMHGRFPNVAINFNLYQAEYVQPLSNFYCLYDKSFGPYVDDVYVNVLLA